MGVNLHTCRTTSDHLVVKKTCNKTNLFIAQSTNSAAHFRGFQIASVQISPLHAVEFPVSKLLAPDDTIRSHAF